MFVSEIASISLNSLGNIIFFLNSIFIKQEGVFQCISFINKRRRESIFIELFSFECSDKSDRRKIRSKIEIKIFSVNGIEKKLCEKDKILSNERFNFNYKYNVTSFYQLL